MKARVSKSKWIQLGIGGVLAVIGLVLALMGNYSSNIIVIVFGFPFLGGGAYFLWKGWHATTERVKSAAAVANAPLPNSIVVRDDSVALEYVEDPPGIDHLHRNTGAWLHWLEAKIEDGGAEVLIPLHLPDLGEEDLHYFPEEFANALDMSANRKVFTPLPSAMKRMSLMVMGAVVGALAIAMIAMGGPQGVG